MEKIKKQVFVSGLFHKELKRRAVEKETSIEREINDILKREFILEGDENNNRKS